MKRVVVLCLCGLGLCGLAGPPALGQPASAARPKISDFDIAVAATRNNRELDRQALSDSGISLVEKDVLITDGQSITSLLESMKVKPDARAEALIRKLNPQLQTDRIPANTRLNLFEIQGRLRDQTNDPIAIIPYNTAREQTKQAYSELRETIGEARNKPSADRLLDAYERASDSYIGTFWESKDDQEIAAAAFRKSKDALELGKAMNYSAEWRTTVMEPAAKSLEAVPLLSTRRNVLLAITAKYTPPATPAGATPSPPPQPVPCQVVWWYGSPEHPIPLPLDEPITVSVGDVFVEIRTPGRVLSLQEERWIEWRQLERHFETQPDKTYDRQLKTKEPCAS